MPFLSILLCILSIVKHRLHVYWSHSPTVIKNIDHSNHVDSVAGIPACVWPCQHPVNTLSPLHRPRASSWSSSGHYSIARSIVDNHLNSDTIFRHSSDSTTQIFRIWCCRVGGLSLTESHQLHAFRF